MAPIRALLLTMFPAAGLAGAARACDCPAPPPPEQALRKSEAVFAGRVTRLEHAGRAPGYRRVHLRVERRWKGAAAATQVVVTGLGGGDCGYPFQNGERYLVYASGKPGLQTNICTRTRKLSEAKEDLAALGKGEPVKDGPTPGNPGGKP